MLVSVILTPALLLGVANAATLAKRWSNGDVATGTTDPNVASGCTYWANSIASSDTCESLNAYFGITIAQLVSWNPSLSSTSCTLTVGWSYCVEAPTVKTTTSTTTTTSKTTTTTTVVTTTTSTSFSRDRPGEEVVWVGSACLWATALTAPPHRTSSVPAETTMLRTRRDADD
ncbi:hypothetical protein KXX52_008874, partial [Aspergillus fumigatus]